jgi:hypothetical protein
VHDNDNYPLEEILYHRTSFQEADEILDNGFKSEWVSLYDLDDLQAIDPNQGEALLKVRTGMDKNELEYYYTIYENGEYTWKIPSELLNNICKISFVAEMTIE